MKNPLLPLSFFLSLTNCSYVILNPVNFLS
nr:MAG TPA: hypothetical protein [Caudoviricetes sp.]